jgi:hypothetical protein
MFLARALPSNPELSGETKKSGNRVTTSKRIEGENSLPSLIYALINCY